MILLVREDREYLRERGETLETDLGVLEIPRDAAAGDVLETHLGESFRVRELRGPDLFRHLERTGAPMMPRDVGLIVGHTGVAAGDSVLDAGTGTGVLAAYLGRLDVDVLSFERDPEFAATARENMELAGVTDRVTVRTGDVRDQLDGVSDQLDDLSDDDPDESDEFDLLTLDLQAAPDVVARAPELLVPGGFVAAYTPFVETTRETAIAAREAGLESIETYETIQRTMDFGDRGSRPSTAGVGHTGYLTFARAP